MNIQELFGKAKMCMLKDQEFPPSLFVELQEVGALPAMVFPDFTFESSLEQQQFFFQVGRSFGEVWADQQLRQVAFISEGWAVRYKHGEKMRAGELRNDPKRVETLLCQVVHVEGVSYSQQIYGAEIVRQAGSVDLLEWHNPSDAQSLLLQSFLAGFVSTRMTIGQIQRVLKDVREGK